MKKFWVILLIGAQLSSLGFADPEVAPAPVTGSYPGYAPKDSKPRGIFWAPLGTLFVPGLGQWTQQKYEHAASYSGVAAFGLGLQYATRKDEDERAMQVGGQLYLEAGALSMYHSFRTAVRSRQSTGDFAFLKYEETPSDILTAPFRFSYLGRWTTLAPLAVATGLALAIGGTSIHNFTFSDGFYSSTQSYLAGTWEETAFRGWMLPVSMHYTNSELGSNLITSTVFAAAHAGNGLTVPWPQFLMGMYLGYLTQRNQWTIGESIFVHAWWDVIIFVADSMQDRTSPVLKLPTLNIRF